MTLIFIDEEPHFTVIIAVPAFLAVILPLSETLATEDLELLQVTSASSGLISTPSFTLSPTSNLMVRLDIFPLPEDSDCFADGYENDHVGYYTFIPSFGIVKIV